MHAIVTHQHLVSFDLNSEHVEELTVVKFTPIDLKLPLQNIIFYSLITK